MLFFGIILGCLGGFASAWWFAGKSFSPEPFFLQFLKLESRPARINTRFMLYELHGKVEELLERVQRVDLKLQGLLGSVRAGEILGKEEQIFQGENLFQPAPVNGDNSILKPASGARSYQDVYRLSREGLSPQEIAQKLKLGRGKVELILSLDKQFFSRVGGV
jgi:hypothetical protein